MAHHSSPQDAMLAAHSTLIVTLFYIDRSLNGPDALGKTAPYTPSLDDFLAKNGPKTSSGLLWTASLQRTGPKRPVHWCEQPAAPCIQPT